MRKAFVRLSLFSILILLIFGCNLAISNPNTVILSLAGNQRGMCGGYAVVSDLTTLNDVSLTVRGLAGGDVTYTKDILQITQSTISIINGTKIWLIMEDSG